MPDYNQNLHHLETELLPAEDPNGEAKAIEVRFQFVSRLRDEFPNVSEQLGWEFFTHAEFTSS